MVILTYLSIKFKSFNYFEIFHTIIIICGTVKIIQLLFRRVFVIYYKMLLIALEIKSKTNLKTNTNSKLKSKFYKWKTLVVN